MNKDTLFLGAMALWIFFLVTVGMYITGHADILAQGMTAWCVGTIMFVSALRKVLAK